MNNLKIFGYNVGFGDALLIEVPEVSAAGKPVKRTILIDVGNALSGAGGNDEILKSAIEDIASRLDGRPVDLYVMTHEHMDHVQGLLYAKTKLGFDIRARRAWLTASAEGESYYDRHPEARRQRKLALSIYDDAKCFLALQAAPPPPAISALMEINNYRASADCVAYLRAIAEEPPAYIHRDVDIAGLTDFREAEFRILAPEEDTSVYYGRLTKRPLCAAPLQVSAAQATRAAPLPPAGVSAGAFYDLVRFRASGLYLNLIAIDKAANNSSIVFEMTWRGWRFLFAGDAEEKSWALMRQRDLLQPVHFLKLSHHGSRNGCPREILDVLLPEKAPDKRKRFVFVSTFDGQYPGVPDETLLEEIGGRANLLDTRELEPGQPWVLAFEG